MSNYTPKELDQIFEELRGFVVKPEYKLKVIDLRKFIDEVYPREADTTHQDLADLKQYFVSLNKRVSHIEECLGINYKLDGRKPVEYSFIKNDIIRDKIMAYYREMLRYEYATRIHKQCFGEFCRLATIQIEFLLNYFFMNDLQIRLLDDEIENVAKKIATSEWKAAKMKWEESGRKGDEPLAPSEDDIKKIKDSLYNNKEETVSKILLSKKSYIFFDRYLKKRNIGDNGISFVSNWTANMRNRKSHGSTSTIDPYENSYLTEEESNYIEEWLKIIRQKVSKYNQENESKIVFDNCRLSPGKITWRGVPKDIRDVYNERKDLVWIYRKPFEEVHEMLQIIAYTCAKELKKNDCI